MTEATLDRTLLVAPKRTAANLQRVRSILPSIAGGLRFDEFISQIKQQASIENQSEAEDCFWELIDEGRIALSHDFKVTKRS